jgi:hypothetical protein
MSTFKALNLTAIDAANNIRRASPILSNKGVDVLKIAKDKGLGISMKGWVEFLKVVGNDPKLISLARSLAITGQIHPITVIKNGDRFNVVSGQRRYIGMVIVDCLRNLLRYGDTDEIKEGRSIFEPAGLDLPLINYAKLEKIKDDLTILAEVKTDVSEEDAEKIAFAANEEAEPLTDIDWAEWIKRSKEKNNATTGAKYTWEELAKIAGKSVGWLRQRQNLLALPKEWKDKLDSREITISAASTYAAEIVEKKATKSRPVPEATETPAAPPAAKLADAPAVEPISLETLADAYDFADVDATIVDIAEPAVRVETPAGESISAESGEDISAEIPDSEPAKDWTEGKRKKRGTKSPKMMKYKEVVELLRSLEKTDEHGIKLLAAVLKMEPSEAEELAGSSLDTV